ncbi:hypothetical protein KIN20_005415 [Parelaphostrongylus tenuis]|uniref:Uncharacterized protein n=1 Tax=Parelaphostrongylus tenuis TaxID=148309 RepID=A0AAD5QK25_PARTN|nr:hypothetical protein KIN20_005415 [Parelaphostrongylus tenuis]
MPAGLVSSSIPVHRTVSYLLAELNIVADFDYVVITAMSRRWIASRLGHDLVKISLLEQQQDLVHFR